MAGVNALLEERQLQKLIVLFLKPFLNHRSFVAGRTYLLKDAIDIRKYCLHELVYTAWIGDT